MSLDMFGHIDQTFESTTGTRTPGGGEYVNGKWVESSGTPTPHSVNIQPTTPRQIQNLEQGGERGVDSRQVWVNDGVIGEIQPSDLWTFADVPGTFKTHALDSRPWHNYCKFIAVRIDGS